MATEGQGLVKRLKRKRQLLRSTITKTLKGLEESALNFEDITVKIAILNETASSLGRLDQEILEEIIDDASEEVLEAERDRAIEIQESVLRAKMAAERRMGTEKENSNYSSNPSLLKLPRLTLEKFDLNSSNWLSWYAQFKTINESEELEDQVKLQYLKMTLVGPARTLVDSYPSTAQNFNKAFEHLKNRYGREELVIRSLYRELLGLIRERPPLIELYDKVNSKVRSLETIGITSEMTAILIPLIEECLPPEIRREWERKEVDMTDKVKKIEVLLEFLGREAECEDRMLVEDKICNNGTVPLATAAALVNTNRGRNTEVKRREQTDTRQSLREEHEAVKGYRKLQCIFCNASHRSRDCTKEMSVEKRWEIVRETRVCFACLNKGHPISKCRLRVDCSYCKGRHYVLVCNKKVAAEGKITANMLASHSFSTKVILKTLLVYACHEEGKVLARVLLDTASHRSYITDRLCNQLRLKSCGEESFRHMLFGGCISENVKHDVHQLELRSLLNDNCFKLKVLRQNTICGMIPSLKDKLLLKRIHDKGVRLVEDEVDRPIDILIGADFLGQMLTGNMKCVEPELIAMETVLGWCVLGTVSAEETVSCLSNVVSSLVCLPSLWDLETLGIEPSHPNSMKMRLEEDCLEHFKRNVEFTNGFYSVALPWIDGHPPLPVNRELALNRLHTTVNRLNRSNLYDEYDKVFRQWESTGFIEVIEHEDAEIGHYLPHRPVVREDKTTKIRPVFDASAKVGNNVSLNDCLHTGPNLIAEILPLLLKFRRESIGLVGDVRQAFLMIRLKFEQDKNVLKFLWIREGKLIIFRHCRVVFGLSPSPFLLNATIRHHLKLFENPVASKLLESLYVDDCILSLENEKQVQMFREESYQLLKSAQFELRGWVASFEDRDEQSVLGIKWCPRRDEISCYKPKTSGIEWTKRSLLSLVGRFFDPLGILAAPLLYPKLLLQECFKRKLSWNEPLPQSMVNSLQVWLSEIDLLDSLYT